MDTRLRGYDRKNRLLSQCRRNQSPTKKNNCVARREMVLDVREIKKLNLIDFLLQIYDQRFKFILEISVVQIFGFFEICFCFCKIII